MFNKFKITVSDLPELEKPFRQNNQGWLGSDVAFSMPLSKDKGLWLFGDTFIADQNNRTDRHSAKIIRNSLGIQTGDLKSQNSINFYWQNEKNQAKSFFKNGEEQGFIWPLSCVLLNKKLYVFALRVVQPDHTNVFGFRIIGNEIIIIENPFDDPLTWNYQFRKIPLDEKLNYIGSNIFHENNFLYIYGFQKEKPSWPADIKMIIARLDLSESQNIADFSKWEFFNKTKDNWKYDLYDINPVIQNQNTEYSVNYVKGIQKYILIGYQIESNKINLRFSETPYGPFSEQREIYDCPENNWNSNYFCYASKAHPELSKSDDELIISYVTNSKVLQYCLEDKRIYFPKFLKIRFG